MRSPLAVARAVRASVLTPSPREVETSYRGFYAWEEGPSVVEPVGHTFLHGFRLGMQSAGAKDVLDGLIALAPEWQGFAAEGAGMSLGIRSAVEPWRRNEFHTLVSASGGRHTYMMHVGMGWALARLPRPLWPHLCQYDPAVAPLILDGFGFHEIFFHTRRTLDTCHVPFPLDRWPGPGPDAQHQLMQGVGRGMWFVGGGSPKVVQELISTFSAQWTPSLWAGVGLAATYAGGRNEVALRDLVERSGPHRGWLRQGSAFAIEARLKAGTANPHTGIAARAICGAEPWQVQSVVDTHRPTGPDLPPGEFSSYERWRALVASGLSDQASQRATA